MIPNHSAELDAQADFDLDFRHNSFATIIVALLSLIIGLGLIFLAAEAKSSFSEGLLLNLGTEMLGALVFFVLFELYRAYLVSAFRRQEQSQTRTLSQTINEVAHAVAVRAAHQRASDDKSPDNQS